MQRRLGRYSYLSVNRPCSPLRDLHVGSRGCNGRPLRWRKSEHGPEDDESDRSLINRTKNSGQAQIPESLRGSFQLLVTMLKDRVFDEAGPLWHREKAGFQRGEHFIDAGVDVGL